VKGATNLRPFTAVPKAPAKTRRPKGSKRHHPIEDVELAARVDAMRRLDSGLKGVLPACRQLVRDGFAQLVSHGDGVFSLRAHGLAVHPEYDRARRRGPASWEAAQVETIVHFLARISRVAPTEENLARFRELLLETKRPPVGAAARNLQERYQKKALRLIGTESEPGAMREAYDWLLSAYLDSEVPDAPLCQGSPRVSLPFHPHAFTFLELAGPAARVSVVCADDNLLVSRWWKAPE
jgi:hypothetical protein